MARPTKYSEETAARIAAAIRVGLTDKDAAAVAGISEDSLARWRTRFAGFADRLTRARAQRALYILTKAREAGKDDWRFWMDLLDRTSPEYRKRSAVELSGPDGGALEIRVIELPLPVRVDDPQDDGESRAPLLIPLPTASNGRPR